MPVDGFDAGGKNAALVRRKTRLAGHFDGAIRRGRKKRIGIGPVPARKTQERAVRLSFSVENSDFSF